MCVFRLGVSDANTIAQEMGDFQAEEIMDLGVGEATVRAGTSKSAFNLRTYPRPDVPKQSPREAIVQAPRQRFCRPRAEVEVEFEAGQSDATDAEITEAEPAEGSQSKRRRRRRSGGGNPTSPDYRHPPIHRPDDGPIDPIEDDLL